MVLFIWIWLPSKFLYHIKDGTRLPDRKLFEKCVYDFEERQFTGEINWEQPTLDGEQRLVYEFCFCENFTVIGMVLQSQFLKVIFVMV